MVVVGVVAVVVVVVVDVVVVVGVVVLVGVVVVVGDVVVVVVVVVSCFSRRHSISSIVSSSYSLISTSSCVSTLTCSAGVRFVRPEYRVRHPSSISVSWRMLLRYLYCCSLLSEELAKREASVFNVTARIQSSPTVTLVI